ncbi:MAG: polyprenyl synthetase family protein [Candidatus Sumerlaeaceae bacterium]|nr:polyprenyl synthetase family protein [Candidatus Sumerlaeaceae bacterium]
MIEAIAQYIAKDLDQVDAHIDSILESDTALVREVGQYVRTNGGKRLRPMLAILSSRAFGYTGNDHTKVAASLELVHTATLLHDDVIDKAPLRRGKPTVNAKWGDDVAILIADYLYSNAFNLAMQSLSPQVLAIICQVTAKMCEGELFQIEKRNDLLTREDYLRIVRKKTAYLFSACTALGSVLGKANEIETAQMSNYGLNFGIAFQITDDTLDLVGSDSVVGKEHWTDIRNGKQTLPLIHAFTSAEPADREDLINCWNNGRDTERIMGHIKKYRGIEYALGEARSFATTAKEQLASLKPSRAVEMFHQLSDYVIQRSS